MSKTPYMMSTLEFLEMKMQLQEFLDQAECVSLGSTGSVCEEEIWYTQVVY